MPLSPKVEDACRCLRPVLRRACGLVRGTGREAEVHTKKVLRHLVQEATGAEVDELAHGMVPGRFTPELIQHTFFTFKKAPAPDLPAPPAAPAQRARKRTDADVHLAVKNRWLAKNRVRLQARVAARARNYKETRSFGELLAAENSRKYQGRAKNTCSSWLS